MTDRNIRRAALTVISIACAACWAFAARFHSTAWGVVGTWLAFALSVELKPKQRGLR